MRLSLYEHRHAVDALSGQRIVYDVAANEAQFGAVAVGGHALVWELSEDGGEGARLSVSVELDPEREWLMRCDRVDFPPGGVAYLHTHPGPGIRVLLTGSITIESGGETHHYAPFEPWFESGPEPVFAEASEAEPTAFVRVMLLPAEWEGKRTIRYVNAEDEEKPKTQRATVFLERRLSL